MVKFARDANGAIQKITHANGMWQDITYDADKNITSLTVATPNKIIAQNTYRYDGNSQLVQFIFNENKEVIAEKEEGNITRLIRSSDLWARESEPEKTWYHYASDEQGSIIFLTGKNDEIKNRYTYDVFGNTIEAEEQIPNRYQYTGQQLDLLTQQYYLRARFYNPAIARFTQEDEYHGDGLNLYAYCANDPVDYYDLSGYYKNPVKIPAERAKEKGFNGIKITKNGGPDFSGTDYIKNWMMEQKCQQK